MTPAAVSRLPLNQIATQQQDAILFDVTSVASIGDEAAYLIFYLSKEDEFNGYGTVIQLDPQSKQAAIYSDLNPEYTYLFYKNEQAQLQTLLWCIEIATQTSDGLFIAHAKSYGRGISADDLKRFQQVDLPDNQPQTQHSLSESYTPAQPPTAPSQAPTQPAPVTASPTQPTPPAAPPVTNPQTTSATPSGQTPVMSNPIADVPASSPAPAPIPNSPLPTQPIAAQSSLPAQSSVSLDQPPAPIETPIVAAPVASPVTPSQPLSFNEEPADNNQQSSDFELNLPPLAPTQQSEPAMPVNSMPAAQPVATAPADILQPIMPQAQVPTQSQSASRQPVGRPPKPLIQDQLWPVSPEDFIWVKNMSRQPISEFKDALHQKVVQQIRTYKPGLMEDWQFTGLFEQAFLALCTTYELIPALRHDILKALLNGRVIENMRKGQQAATSPISNF